MIINNLRLHTAIWMKLTNRKLNKRWQTHASKYSMIAFIESSNPAESIHSVGSQDGWEAQEWKERVARIMIWALTRECFCSVEVPEAGCAFRMYVLLSRQHMSTKCSLKS